ncbi:MAG: hypothetical protein P1U87_11355 [Verrucomicrobiales bacterium]|nr:hypothetical protein [Verrucomicrobiales bacterium]
MSANSSPLFLLNNETQREKSPEEFEALPIKPSQGSVVEAGNVTFRMIPERIGNIPHDPREYSPSFEIDDSEFPPIEWSKVEASIPLQPLSDRARLGFSSHLLQMGGALCKTFAVLLCIGLLGGICSFLIGVAIPFGLMH